MVVAGDITHHLIIWLIGIFTTMTWMQFSFTSTSDGYTLEISNNSLLLRLHLNPKQFVQINVWCGTLWGCAAVNECNKTMKNILHIFLTFSVVIFRSSAAEARTFRREFIACRDYRSFLTFNKRRTFLLHSRNGAFEFSNRWFFLVKNFM